MFRILGICAVNISLNIRITVVPVNCLIFKPIAISPISLTKTVKFKSVFISFGYNSYELLTFTSFVVVC